MVWFNTIKTDGYWELRETEKVKAIIRSYASSINAEIERLIVSIRDGIVILKTDIDYNVEELKNLLKESTGKDWVIR